MDVWEFLQRSEWPVVIGGALICFRKPFTRLLDHIRPTKVSGWGVSAEFSLDKAEALTVETRDLIKEPPKQLERTSDGMAALMLDEPPQIIVLKSWMALESAMGQGGGRDLTPWEFGRHLEETAREKYGLTSQEVLAIRELRNIRDQVAHRIDFPLSQEDAYRFYAITSNLLARMKLIKPSPSPVKDGAGASRP